MPRQHHCRVNARRDPAHDPRPRLRHAAAKRVDGVELKGVQRRKRAISAAMASPDTRTIELETGLAMVASAKLAQVLDTAALKPTGVAAPTFGAKPTRVDVKLITSWLTSHV